MAWATCMGCGENFKDEELHWVCNDCNSRVPRPERPEMVSTCCYNNPAHEGKAGYQNTSGGFSGQSGACGRCGKPLTQVDPDPTRTTPDYSSNSGCLSVFCLWV